MVNKVSEGKHNNLVEVGYTKDERMHPHNGRFIRPSLRARLAMKKAIVAANSADPQRSKQREAQEAVASQRDIYEHY